VRSAAAQIKVELTKLTLMASCGNYRHQGADQPHTVRRGYRDSVISIYPHCGAFWICASQCGDACFLLPLLRYGAVVRESEIQRPDSDLDGGWGPADEQLVRMDTARVARATGEVLVLTVAGEIDLSTVTRLRAAVAAGFEDLCDGDILIIDLTEVTFLASHGLQVLIEATQDAQRRRTPLGIVRGRARAVVHPIHVSGLDDVLPLFDTVEEATNALNALT
jgi:anti-sigma B factor antagonist